MLVVLLDTCARARFGVRHLPDADEEPQSCRVSNGG